MCVYDLSKTARTLLMSKKKKMLPVCHLPELPTSEGHSATKKALSFISGHMSKKRNISNRVQARQCLLNN